MIEFNGITPVSEQGLRAFPRRLTQGIGPHLPDNYTVGEWFLMCGFYYPGGPDGAECVFAAKWTGDELIQGDIYEVRSWNGIYPRLSIYPRAIHSGKVIISADGGYDSSYTGTGIVRTHVSDGNGGIITRTATIPAPLTAFNWTNTWWCPWDGDHIVTFYYRYTSGGEPGGQLRAHRWHISEAGEFLSYDTALSPTTGFYSISNVVDEGSSNDFGIACFGFNRLCLPWVYDFDVGYPTKGTAVIDTSAALWSYDFVHMTNPIAELSGSEAVFPGQSRFKGSVDAYGNVWEIPSEFGRKQRLPGSGEGLVIWVFDGGYTGSTVPEGGKIITWEWNGTNFANMQSNYVAHEPNGSGRYLQGLRWYGDVSRGIVADDFPTGDTDISERYYTTLGGTLKWHAPISWFKYPAEGHIVEPDIAQVDAFEVEPGRFIFPVWDVVYAGRTDPHAYKAQYYELARIENRGQLYVNLSHDQDNPDWVSACGGYARMLPAEYVYPFEVELGVDDLSNTQYIDEADPPGSPEVHGTGSLSDGTTSSYLEFGVLMHLTDAPYTSYYETATMKFKYTGDGVPRKIALRMKVRNSPGFTMPKNGPGYPTFNWMIYTADEALPSYNTFDEEYYDDPMFTDLIAGTVSDWTWLTWYYDFVTPNDPDDPDSMDVQGWTEFIDAITGDGIKITIGWHWNYYGRYYSNPDDYDFEVRIPWLDIAEFAVEVIPDGVHLAKSGFSPDDTSAAWSRIHARGSNRSSMGPVEILQSSVYTQVVGSGSILDDGKDATYVVSGATSAGKDRLQIKLPPITATSASKVKLHLRAQADNALGGSCQYIMVLNSGHWDDPDTIFLGNFANSSGYVTVTEGGIKEFIIGLDDYDGANLLSGLAEGAYLVIYGSTAGLVDYQLTIYEAWVGPSKSDWQPTYANANSSGAPAWYTCCSHQAFGGQHYTETP